MLPISLLSSPLARYGLLALGAIAVGWFVVDRLDGRGYARCEADHKDALAESLQRGLEQAQEIARQDAEITGAYEVWRTRYITKLQTAPQEIADEVHPDCTGCGLSPDGLRALNAIRQGAVAPSPGTPQGGLPTPQTFGDGPLPGTRGIPGQGQPHVLRLRGEAQSPGGRGAEEGGV